MGAKKKAESELLISGAQERENLDLIKRVPRTAHGPSASLRGSASRVSSLGTEKLPHSKTIRWQTCVGSPKNREVGQSSRAHKRQLTFLTGQPRLRPPQHPALLTPSATVPTRCCVRAREDREFAEFRTREPGPTADSPPRPGRLEKTRWQDTRVCKARERATARVKGGWVGAFTISDQKGNQSHGFAPVTCPLKPVRTTFKPGPVRSDPGEPWSLPGDPGPSRRRRTSFALLSPSYPGSGRTDAGRRGGSKTQPPAAARSSMKAQRAAKPDPLASSAGGPSPLATAQPDPSSAPPWATAPAARPATQAEPRSRQWPPADRCPRSARTRAPRHRPLWQLCPCPRTVPWTLRTDSGHTL